MNSETPRPSYLLTLCAVFAVIAAVQVMTTPVWSTFWSPTEWNIAWCDSSSPLYHRIFLYTWSATGFPIAYYLLKGFRSEGYIWVIISYVLFWSFASVAAGPPYLLDADSIFLLIFLGLMLWSYTRWNRRANKAEHSIPRGSRLST